MPISSTINYWLRADIALKAKSDGSTTTVTVVNREFLAVTNVTYLPILISIDSIGAEMGQYLPNFLSGTITLDDNFHSFAADLKFSDLLDRYVIQDQAIEIFFAEHNIDVTEPTSWTSVFKGLCTGWNRPISNAGSTIEVSIEQAPFKRKNLGMVIRPQITGFADAPNASLGALVPLNFGDSSEVLPLWINNSRSAPSFAWATNFEDKFVAGAISAYYTLDTLGDWDSWEPTGGTYSAGNVWGPVTTADAFTLFWEEAYVIPTANPGKIVTGGRLRHDGTQAGTFSSGTITIEIYKNPTLGTALLPGELIARAIMKRSDYASSYNGGSAFNLEFTFDRPFLWNADGGLYFVAYETLDVGQTAATYYAGNVAIGSYFVRKQESDFAWVASSTASAGPFVEFYGVDATVPALSSNYQDTEGFIASIITLSQKTPGTSQSNIDLSRLPLILDTEGILDDSSGTITGVASRPLTGPHHLAKLLSYNWDGSNWTLDPNWDNTTYSATHAPLDSGGIYWRKINGTFSGGQITLEDALIAICRNSGCRIGVNNSGKPGLYAWGTNLTAQKTFTQENARILSVEIEDLSAVINHAVIIYGSILRDINPESLAYRERIFPFTEMIDWYTGANVLATNLVGQSKALFGERFLEDNLFEFVGGGSSQTAEFLARYFFANFNQPGVLVNLRTDFDDNKTLKIFDVLQLSFPDLPAYYGTSPNAVSANFNGLPIDLAQGYTTVRAELYRGQIMGRLIKFDDEDGPTLDLTIRLLTNYPNDPT